MGQRKRDIWCTNIDVKLQCTALRQSGPMAGCHEAVTRRFMGSSLPPNFSDRPVSQRLCGPFRGRITSRRGSDSGWRKGADSAGPLAHARRGIWRGTSVAISNNGRTVGHRIGGLAGLALLAGCGHKSERPALPSTQPLPPAARPLPPGGAPDGVVIPQSDGQGGYRTINSDLTPAEAVWHLRSAINVAALACDRQGKAGVAAGYNALLARQKKAFAAAYRAETVRAGAKALDAHVTQIYNFYAQPPAQAGFCAVATEVGKAALDVTPEGFEAYAPTALAKLQAPFDDFYRAYERYKVDLIAWQTAPKRADPLADAPLARIAAKAAPAGPPWRIQLGAYSGEQAAKDAWGRISKRLHGVEAFAPRYEPVPGKSLVRVQIGPVADRSEAIALCAAAAGAGLDCLPLSK